MVFTKYFLVIYCDIMDTKTRNKRKKKKKTLWRHCRASNMVYISARKRRVFFTRYKKRLRLQHIVWDLGTPETCCSVHTIISGLEISLNFFQVYLSKPGTKSPHPLLPIRVFNRTDVIGTAFSTNTLSFFP